MSIELDRIDTLLKDVIIVKLDKPPTGFHGIHLPQEHRTTVQLIRGRVLKIGTKFRYKEDVKIGDYVYVPSQFGNPVSQFDDRVRFYDGEDVACIEIS